MSLVGEHKHFDGFPCHANQHVKFCVNLYEIINRMTSADDIRMLYSKVLINKQISRESRSISVGRYFE